MKKTFILLALVCLGLFAKAQTTTFRPAYIGIGGFQEDKGVSGNLTFEVRSDPKIANNFSFGFRFQFAVTPSSGYVSVGITSDYYFTRPEKGLRIFAGAGIGGVNELKGPYDDSDNLFDFNNSKFGFFPRIGFEVWRFRLSAEYDFTGGTNNYAAINLGFLLGNGKKK